MKWWTLVWSKALKARGSKGFFIWVRSASARCFGACDGQSEPRRGSKGSNVKRAQALETAYGCTGGAKL
jgi:hypothetical protein